MIEQLNSEMIYELILALGAFLLAMFLTPIYTYFAYKHKWWKKQKQVAVTGEKLKVMNKLHEEKIRRKVPTMAGIIFVVAVGLTTFLCNWDRAQTWLPLAAFVGGGIIGLLDDIINLISNRKVAGLRAPIKLALISAMALAMGWYFAVKLGWTGIYIPFVGSISIGVVGMILVFAFAVVATSNAVNITDGLDGLAGGLTALAYGSFAVIALMQEQWGLAGFCFTVVGALLSYIWFNVSPARFWMGDTGSFALGAGLGVVAMMTNCFLLLPIIGIVFVVETGSSLIQMIAKKFFHKKVFVSAPLHHHLEAKGWEESKIVMRFWVVGGVFAFVGIFLAVGGGIV